jgi:hypothetical protein
MNLPESLQNKLDQDWATMLSATAWMLNAINLLNPKIYYEDISTKNPARPFQKQLVTKPTDIGIILQAGDRSPKSMQKIK